jgi:hypothetical protein
MRKITSGKYNTHISPVTVKVRTARFPAAKGEMEEKP